ncbi:MAG: hypothetical protein GYB31_03060 [Bacteroidetes bacterium]|nr:hypothetical protein [Bacteroidota bacterium]
MRRITSAILLIFLVNISFAQTENTSSTDTVKVLTGSFEFIAPLPETSRLQFKSENNDRSSPVKVPYGGRVQVLFERNDTIFYRYWHYDDEENAALYNAGNPTFSMLKEDFERMSIPLYRQFKGFQVGAYTIPFRLRAIGTKVFDFESSLSLQSNFIFGFGPRTTQNSLIDFSLGIGLTAAILEPGNSNINNTNSSQTASALTLSAGLLFKPKPFINLGVFLGADYLGAKDQDVNWRYDKGTWVGIGINVSFNNIKTTAAPTNKG